MTDARAERRAIEQGGRQHVQGVEPAAGLSHVLDDEVARVMTLEPVRVLEGIVHLGERHRPGLEPAIENLGDPTHRRATGWIVGIRAHEIVDERPMQIVDLHAEIALQVGDRSVHIDARIGRIVASPHRDR